MICINFLKNFGSLIRLFLGGTSIHIHYSLNKPTNSHYPYRLTTMPHNAYNVFFTLERMRIVDTMMDASSGESESNKQQKSYDLAGYESLVFPDLPPRYQHLQLPMGWFVPGKNSKRKHTKSHRNGKLNVCGYLI
jgi:hypothetical protein